MASIYNQKPIGEYTPSMKVAGIMYPMGHFGMIWKANEAELYPWELIHQEEQGDVRVANGVTLSYTDSLETMHQVISLWVHWGHTVADERQANIEERQSVDRPFVAETELGFLANRSSG